MLTILSGCNIKKRAGENMKSEVRPVKHPEWTYSSNIYEVNIRQFSPKGDFKGVEKQLPRLHKMGVDILWLMPIHPIGVKNRKGGKGSYYSVKDYLAVDPDYGTIDDFKRLVKATHQLGMHIIIDWVANHTAWDNKMITDHPEWYTHDKKGKIVSPVDDWADVADLDYDKPALRQYIIDAMKFWVNETDIDGFRCDVAFMVPTDFWDQARVELDAIKPMFMLAEAEDPKLQVNAFDMTYAWDLHFPLNRIAKGDTNALIIDRFYAKNDKKYAKDDYRMLFTSNHDENTWKGSEYERMGDAAKTFAVLCYTLPGMPLIYTGQESAVTKRLSFFETDTVNWGKYPLADFYNRLNLLKKDNKALWNGVHGGEFIRIKTNDDKALYVYARKNDNNIVYSIFNLTKKAQKLNVKDNSFDGEYTNVFSGAKQKLDKSISMTLKPWEYIILKRN